MINSQLVITLSIILMASAPVSAGRSTYTYKAIPSQALAYVKPTFWSDCGDIAETGREVFGFAQAKGVISSDIAPKTEADLEKATCSWAVQNNYAWFKFEHEKDGSICSVYVIAGLMTLNRNDPKLSKFVESHTKTANNEMGKCTPIPPSYDTATQTDEVVEKVDETKVEDIDLEDIPLPKLVRRNATYPKTKTPSYEITGEDMSSLFNEQEEHDALHTNLMGGWQGCSKANHRHVPRFFNVLTNRGLISGVHVYTENVVHCEQQLVNGLNFDVKVAFNGNACWLAFHASFNDEVSQLTTAPRTDDIPLCIEVFKPRF